MEDKLDRDKLQRRSLLRKKAHATLLKKKSKVYESFLKMEEATYGDSNSFMSVSRKKFSN